MNLANIKEKELLEIYISTLRWAAHNGNNHCWVNNVPEEVVKLLFNCGMYISHTQNKETILVGWDGNLEEIITKHFGDTFDG